MSPENLNQFFNNPRNFLLIAWSLFWKGWALWRAAKNEQKIWYGFLLVFNLFGLLEIVYLLFFQKKGKLWQKIIKKV
jgi:hypothetical protein